MIFNNGKACQQNGKGFLYIYKWKLLSVRETYWWNALLSQEETIQMI